MIRDSDTGGGSKGELPTSEIIALKDKRIRELEEEVQRLKEREVIYMSKY
jgi:hypothetical protein